MAPAVTPTAERPRSRLRLAPVPVSAPPYDDELSGSVDPGRSAPGGHQSSIGVQGALALDFVLPSGLPAVPRPPPRLRLVGRELVTSGRRSVPDEADARRPDAGRWAALIVQAVVEVMAGDRPLTQLVRWTTPEVYEELTWRRQRGPARLTEPTSSRRSVVTSVHVCQPADDVAEACATIRRDGRVTAMALRLEADRDAWRCTALALR